MSHISSSHLTRSLPGYNVFNEIPDIYVTQVVDPNEQTKSQALKHRDISIKLPSAQDETSILCLAVIKSINDETYGVSFWAETSKHFNVMKPDSMRTLTSRECSRRMVSLETSILEQNNLSPLKGPERWKRIAKIWLDNQEKNELSIDKSFSDNQNKVQDDTLNVTKKTQNQSNTFLHSNSFKDHTSSEIALPQTTAASLQNIESSIYSEEGSYVAPLENTQQSNMSKTQESHKATPKQKKRKYLPRNSLATQALMRTLCQAVIESTTEEALGGPCWRKIAAHYNKIKQKSMIELDAHECSGKMDYIERKNKSILDKLSYLSGVERWRRVAKIYLNNQEENFIPSNQSLSDNQSQLQLDALHVTKKAKHQSSTSPHSNSSIEQTYFQNALQQTTVSNQNVESCSSDWTNEASPLKNTEKPEYQEPHHATQTEITNLINWNAWIQEQTPSSLSPVSFGPNKMLHTNQLQNPHLNHETILYGQLPHAEYQMLRNLGTSAEEPTGGGCFLM